MKAEQLDGLLKNGDAPVVFDVRSAFEYDSGHIPGAIHAPLPGVLKAAEAVVNSKEDLLVIVCEHGPRAQMARMFLKFCGYKNLQLLEGHMSRWRSSGRSLQTD
jgi:hydroxyacylglutathione hydrolase